MCDTFVTLPSLSSRHSTLLAKNSDREPDEAQAIEHITRQVCTDKTVKCTFIEIPQVKETYACILSRPFHMWGAEMGVNEHGVAIGNEAVFTKIKLPGKNDGLTGMDLLRLGLERSKSAEAALNNIIELLTSHGQDACGGYRNRSFYYHNSFVIADPKEAYVLETVDRQWAFKKIKDHHSISNKLGINDDYDRVSPEAKQLALKKKLWRKDQNFDFEKVFSDWLFSTFAKGKTRRKITRHGIQQCAGAMTVASAIQILQTHHKQEGFNPKWATAGSVCMHATGFWNPSQTTGSMVAELRQDKPHTIWLTGTSMPCLSVYFPIFLGSKVLEHVQPPSANNDGSLWWKAETLHRWICKSYTKRSESLRNELRQMQSELILEERSLFQDNPSIDALDQLSEKAYHSVTDWYDQKLHQYRLI